MKPSIRGPVAPDSNNRKSPCRSGPSSLCSFEDCDDALAAGGADADHAAALAVFVQLLGEAGDDTAAGRREGVGGGQRAAVDVELLTVDLAQRFVAAELLPAEVRVLPGLQRAQHLRGEGLVDLVVVEVLQF